MLRYSDPLPDLPQSPGEAREPTPGRKLWQGWGGIPANKPAKKEGK